MNPLQKKVKQFHEVTGLTVGESPAIRDAKLRRDLIEEEAKETIEALDRGDLVAAVDGLADLLYVVYGAAVSFGVDLGPIFDEVHKTNMAKKDGPVREDGKRLKPEGWKPPNIEKHLKAQGWQG